jgi:glycosyltransferase involved in cell wall biosynthesis
VIVEGGFLGKAVVGTKVGGIPDLIEDEKMGLGVRPRNPEEIAHAVIRLLENPEFSKQLGGRLRAKVLDDFTEDRMIEKIHRLYQEVLNEKGIQALPCETLLA